MSELRADLEQWAPDLPGFGESPPAHPHTVRRYVADVTEFLETFGRPVHLIGNSMGGLICVLIASERPDLVRTVSLLSPAMPQYLLPWGAQAMAAVATPRVGEWMLGRVNAEPSEDQVRRLLPMLYGNPEAVDPDELDFALRERLRWVGRPHSTEVLLSALRSLVVEYLRPRRQSAWWAARKMLCPTMVLVAEKDTLVGARSARQWCRARPKARVIWLKGSGHVAMMEYPSAVGHLIRTFLADVAAGERGSGNRDVPFQSVDDQYGNTHRHATVELSEQSGNVA